MTTNELRADADRRRRLAEAATPGPWHYVRVSDWSPQHTVQTEVDGSGSDVADCSTGISDARHIAANDPPAVLASCEHALLLADAMDGLRTIAGGSDHAAIEVAKGLLARFAALGLSLLLVVGCADADCREEVRAQDGCTRRSSYVSGCHPLATPTIVGNAFRCVCPGGAK